MFKITILILLITASVYAQKLDGAFPLLGSITPRHSNDIADNNWSIGAETMDRDYTVYKNWKEYLGPLGFKRARIQAGWMKTEPEKGVYHFSWLDEIIFDMHEQGVKPWMNLAWSNKHYAEWTANNRGRVPKTKEGLEAWAQFVRALVVRYGHIINEWEIWNEVSTGKISNPIDYVNLVQYTVPAIRELQPDATIMILALDHYTFKSIRPGGAFYPLESEPQDSVETKVWEGVENPEHMQQRLDYVTVIMDSLQTLGLLDQVDVISYHPYDYNPDDVYPHVSLLREWAKGYAPHLTIFQGENGAPSERIEYRGLRKYDWTETTQAKWALRRMLGDLGHDVVSSYFGIMDMFYQEDVNRKGLLYANPDKTVHHKKEAYLALQNMAAIFDNTLERIKHYPYVIAENVPLTVLGYENNHSEQQIVTLWFHDQVPAESNTKTPVDLTLPCGNFEDPVYVDVRTGEVFDVPDGSWSQNGTQFEFADIPCYDSPILIADKTLIPINSKQ